MTPRLTVLVLALSVGPAAVPASAQDKRTSPARFDSPLLVGTKGDRLRLASPRSYDVREIRLAGVDEIVEVKLAQSSTKAVVLTRSRKLMAFDLSRDSSIATAYATRLLLTPALATPSGTDSAPPRASHSVRSARFAFVVDGSLLVVDESLATMSIWPSPSDLVAAAIRSTTCLLTVSTSGLVTVRDLSSGREVVSGPLPLTATDDVDIVAAPLSADESCQDRAHAGFVVLVHRAVDSLVWRMGTSTTTSTRSEALGLAATALAESPLFYDEVARSVCRDVACRLAVVRPDVDLYLPVLEMDGQETVWPAKVDVWRQLAANGIKPDKQPPAWWPLYEAYASTIPKNQCLVYTQTIEYRRSWLIQYWLYFPFDLGNRSPHLHDTEHFFVEVDKRGGRPTRLLGDGHGLVSGNNLYTAARDTGYSLTLPVFAFVELGKHATAPDVDKNGFFTPGIDENHYNERSKVWGVRDVIGSINNELLVYDSSMTIPRTSAARYGHADFATLFPGNNALPMNNRSCKVEEWVPKPSATCADKDSLEPEALVSCAMNKIENHSDFTNPDAIFKNELFPTVVVRMVGGRMADGVGRSFALNLVGEISSVPLVRRLPLTGRVSVAASFRRVRNLNPLIPENSIKFAPIFGYEKFLTNLVGFSLHAGGWDNGILGAGLFVEAPLGRSGFNLTVNVGPTVIGGQSTRVGMSVALGRVVGGRHSFLQ